jgi:hypothetical protein
MFAAADGDGVRPRDGGDPKRPVRNLFTPGHVGGHRRPTK